MTELNQISQEEKQNRLLDALSYIPLLFILNLLHNGKNENSMWHSKMGALSSLIFFIPLITGGYISTFFGGMLYGFYFVYIGLSANKAWNGEKYDIPLLSKIAIKIPLEKFLKKNPTTEVNTASTVQTTVESNPTIQTNINQKP